MKKSINIKSTGLLLIAIVFVFSSCYKEEDLVPVFKSFEFLVDDGTGNMTPVTSAPVGQEVFYKLDADLDLASIWSGEREVRKNTDGTDMTDFDSGKPIFVYSNDYDDYGIVGSKGLAFNLADDGTWFTSYTFQQAGEKNIKLILTNHGYNGPDYINIFMDLNFTVTP